MNLGDTIVAVSSPAGAGERAIVRLSGPRAVEIVDGLFTPDSRRGPVTASVDGRRELAAAPASSAWAGRLEVPGSDMSVPVTVYLMRGLRSYTREDVVELHAGAWPAVVPLVVMGLIGAGARPADPGEFTFRALVSGRLDLAQAEAVAAVIGASNEAMLRAAGDLLAGRLSREVAPLADRVLETLALVEADLDFSDQDLAAAPPQEIADRISTLRHALADLGRRARGLETFGGEVRLALVGRPNAGKSSLFNRLLAADRAIVSPDPGTTRDELRAALHAGGLVFTLSDVAGLDRARDESQGRDSHLFPHRDSAGEAAGRRGGTCRPGEARIIGDCPYFQGVGGDEAASKARAKAMEAVGRADLVILVLDAAGGYDEGAEDLLERIASPMVIAITKCDLAPPDRARAWAAARGLAAETVATSAATGQGIEALSEALVRAVEGGAVDRESVGPVVTARHRAALERAAAALARAGRAARRGAAAGELTALEMREALEALGEIGGRGADADVLGEIFGRFCVGK